MKKILSALALVICTACSFSVANASPYFTTSYGYQLDLENTKKHQEQEYGYSQDDHGFVTGTIGAYLTPNTKVQLEYSKMKANGNKLETHFRYDPYDGAKKINVSKLDNGVYLVSTTIPL